MTDINMMMYSANPKLIKLIKKFHKELKLFYKNPFYEELLDLYCTEGDIEHTEILLLLDKHKMGPQVIVNATECLKESVDLGVKTLSTIRDKYENIISHQILVDKQDSHKTPSEFVRAMSELEVSFDPDDAIGAKLTSTSFDTIDVSKAKESLGDPIKSFMPQINDSFTINGYVRHQLISVVGAPGSGKSLFLMNEACNFLLQGKKVIYLALGDLTMIDFLIRVCSIMLRKSLDEITLNLEYYYGQFMSRFPEEANNLKILLVDPDDISIHDFRDWVISNKFNEEYDILIMDYDTNFKSTHDMYSKGEEIYNVGCALSRGDENFDLVFIASQPKAMFYESEIIPMSGANESSRKNQILDVIITIGKHPTAINSIGYINLAKVRRNGRMNYFPYFRDVTGIFHGISLQKYTGFISADTLKTMSEKVEEESESLQSQMSAGMSK